jgi:uncharacterized protein YijF (DUF1287 family)
MKLVHAWGITGWLLIGTGVPGLFAQPPLALARAAEAQIGVTTVYDPAYVRLDFPGGDIPRQRGVCADVIVRAFRDALNLDLQRLVHEDMKQNFNLYPQVWGLKRPDPHIDHRRVLNLMTYFQRRGWSVPATSHATDYTPGDIVAWRLPGNNLPHIGVVSARRTPDDHRPLCVHNIGSGTKAEDVLFSFRITGHYRLPPNTNF